MTHYINMNKFICIDNYLIHLKDMLTMSIPVVCDSNFAICYPFPSRNWKDTKISSISIKGGLAFCKILVMNNLYRQCKYVFKKCHMIINTNKLIYIDLECYLYALLVIYCFFRQNL